MKSIMVTGGCGMIGSNLVKRLVKEGWDVYVADNLWRGKVENLNDENGKPVIDLDTHFFKKDLSIYEEAESVVGITDYVVHLADIVAGIDYVFSNQGELFRVNNLINSNLFAACRKAGKEKIKGLLYVGTVCSFPLTRQNMLNPEPLHEDELFPAMPESAYGWSKLMGQLEIGYLEKETGIPCCTLMFHNVYGTPTGARGAEGGANLFKFSYFHKPAVLAQSPQFYKQMMVGVFDRVFETGPVFRAEKHNTKRHLNEYTSLDFEMGYIDSFEEIMAMETGFLQYAVALLQKDYAKELQILKVQLPKVDKIPAVRFDKAKELVSEKYNRKIRNPYDLEPEEEALIGRYFKEEYDADFVFVTHYPSKKRPFYAMDDPSDEKFTLSFDLLFHGLEVTTGGQRIHDYDQLKAKIAARGMEEEGMEQYLDTFKHGMPPHGGLGIGLERLTMQLLGEENVREACLFPRDLNRLEP